VKDADLFNAPSILESLSVKDIEQRFQELFRPEQMAVSIVRPMASKTPVSV
jgi:predicted Zn-dependent peptidase